VIASGPGPPVFRQFVVKVHSRCNLACDHCYVYEHADQSWRSRPVVMSHETMRWTALRIGEHCREHALPAAVVILHGGEPLLAGAHRVRRFVRSVRAAVPEGCALHLGMQTNGILIDENLCELFVAEGIKVGISLDGDRAGNDRHRTFADGRSSYDAAVAAVRLLGQPAYRTAFSGLLCTVDVANDPVRTYESLRDLSPPRLDFLLPHATWDDPPARGPAGAPFAEWLIAVHDRWLADGRPVPIRLFDSIGRLAAGESSLTESLGLEPTDLVVIETDGAIEQADSLKTAYDRAPATGFDVHRHRLSEAATHPGFAARAGGPGALCAQCRACPVVDLCGGGLYAHRFRSGSGFQNPSVYCPDLLALVTHVDPRRRVGRGAGEHLPTHSLSGTDFDALAGGHGGESAIAALVEAQHSLRRAQVADWVRTQPAVGPAADAWDALCELDEIAPGAVRQVLLHPYVGLWASRVRPDPSGVGYLWGVVLAAAVRAGVARRATVAPSDGTVPLPGLGALAVPDADGPVVIETAAASLVVDGRAVPLTPGHDHDWRPLRAVHERSGAPIVLDDVDPYRACFVHPVAPRLTDRGLDHWRRALADTWVRVEHDFPGHVPSVRHALSTITPLAAGRSTSVSATHRDAFGAIALALAPVASPSNNLMTRELLHEVQHVKMGAVLDLFVLLDPQDRTHHGVGWRDDPRPLESVLQGAYAHLAVVEYWRRTAESAHGRAADHATERYRTVRDQTRGAISVLTGSGSLTALGRRWVEAMEATGGSWTDSPSPQVH
jgi:uncharacterized protein